MELYGNDARLVRRARCESGADRGGVRHDYCPSRRHYLVAQARKVSRRPPHLAVVGPQDPVGSISPYLQLLVDGIAHRGFQVTWIGSHGVPYDVEAGLFWTEERSLEAAGVICSELEQVRPDIAVFHVGRLEIEQYLPLISGTRGIPRVLHAHNVGWDLPTLLRQATVDSTTLMRAFRSFFTTYFFFTTLARHSVGRLLGVEVGNSPVVPLPPTIENVDRTDDQFSWLTTETSFHDRSVVIASVLGFYSPWKAVGPLMKALTFVDVDMRVLFAGPGWSEHVETGHISTFVEVVVLDRYLSGKELAYLVGQSDVGILPYTTTGRFQGSGMLPNYVALGVPVVAFENAAFADMPVVSVSPAEPRLVAQALVDATVAYRPNQRLLRPDGVQRMVNEHLDAYAAALESALVASRF